MTCKVSPLPINYSSCTCDFHILILDFTIVISVSWLRILHLCCPYLDFGFCLRDFHVLALDLTMMNPLLQDLSGFGTLPSFLTYVHFAHDIPGLHLALYGSHCAWYIYSIFTRHAHVAVDYSLLLTVFAQMSLLNLLFACCLLHIARQNSISWCCTWLMSTQFAHLVPSHYECHPVILHLVLVHLVACIERILLKSLDLSGGALGEIKGYKTLFTMSSSCLMVRHHQNGLCQLAFLIGSGRSLPTLSLPSLISSVFAWCNLVEPDHWLSLT